VNVKLISNSASIDRKVKFYISPKSNVAIKILRHHLGTILAQQFRGKPLSETQDLWFELAVMALAKEKIQAEGEEHPPVVVVN
jgi:ATP-dependent RNA helicase DHX29